MGGKTKAIKIDNLNMPTDLNSLIVFLFSLLILLEVALISEGGIQKIFNWKASVLFILFFKDIQKNVSPTQRHIVNDPLR